MRMASGSGRVKQRDRQRDSPPIFEELCLGSEKFGDSG